MDRSFLTNASVVAASRHFVCIRLATYEDEAEAEFMKSVYIPRSGQLENTTFAILASDGRRKLTAAGRGPNHIFRGASAMALRMDRIAAEFSYGTNPLGNDAQLPLMKNLDLALNVASADGLPLIVTVAETEARLTEINQHLVSSAWKPSLAGQFAYASVSDLQELKPLSGDTSGEGILVIEPGQFGLSGKVLTRLPADAASAAIESKLLEVVTTFPRRRKDHNSHVRLGIQIGVDWKSQLPETDPMSVRARQRARGSN